MKHFLDSMSLACMYVHIYANQFQIPNVYISHILRKLAMHGIHTHEIIALYH